MIIGRGNPPKPQTKHEIQNPMKLLTRSTLALTMALAVLFPITSPSAEPVEEKRDSKMMEHCEKMKEQKAKMKADMKAQDSELTALAAKMNSAPADKKMDEMAALVTQMVEQRIAMGERKAKMEEEMMAHMMKHTEMGKDSMAKCPMMKGMNRKSAEADKARPEAKN